VILSTHILPEIQRYDSRVQIVTRPHAVADTPGRPRRRDGSDQLVWNAAVCRGSRNCAHRRRGSGGETRQPPLRLCFKRRRDPAENLATLAMKGVGLRGLTPEYKSLEQVFVELTTAMMPTPTWGQRHDGLHHRLA